MHVFQDSKLNLNLINKIMPLFTLLDTKGNERQISCAGNKVYELEKAY